MLILQGVLRAATVLGGGTNKNRRSDSRASCAPDRNSTRGLVEVQTITVPNVDGWASKVGKQVNLPVRAWAPNAKVGFMFEAPAAGSAPVAA